MDEENVCHKCEEYQRIIDDTKESLKWSRDRYDTLASRFSELDTKMMKTHQAIKNLREDMAIKFRKKELKSVKDFNAFLREYGQISNGHLAEIKAEDMYSAKVNLVIDGTYTNNERDIEALKNAILNNIRLANEGGVEVRYIEIDSVYDVEEFADTKEG